MPRCTESITGQQGMWLACATVVIDHITNITVAPLAAFCTGFLESGVAFQLTAYIYCLRIWKREVQAQSQAAYDAAVYALLLRNKGKFHSIRQCWCSFYLVTWHKDKDKCVLEKCVSLVMAWSVY